MLTFKDLRRPFPDDWELVCSVDTGTYMSATFAVALPDAHVAFIEEFPNYRYVGGEPELNDESVPEWSRRVLKRWQYYRPRDTRIRNAWVDQNSQFKTELRKYGINTRDNRHGLELRVETGREYVKHRRVWFAPWLTVLPYELEHARWPDESTTAGRFVRIKQNDHTLDTFEHTLSHRPLSKRLLQQRQPTWVEAFMAKHRRVDRGRAADPHLGAL